MKRKRNISELTPTEIASLGMTAEALVAAAVAAGLDMTEWRTAEWEAFRATQLDAARAAGLSDEDAEGQPITPASKNGMNASAIGRRTTAPGAKTRSISTWKIGRSCRTARSLTKADA